MTYLAKNTMTYLILHVLKLKPQHILFDWKHILL